MSLFPVHMFCGFCPAKSMTLLSRTFLYNYIFLVSKDTLYPSQLSMHSAYLLPAFLAMTRAARLFATTYNGTVDTLTLSKDSDKYTLAHSASITACGEQPSWLTLDSVAKVLYCANEADDPSGSLTAFAIGDDGTLAPQAVAKTVGGDVNSQLYGGDHGNGFIALAE